MEITAIKELIYELAKDCEDALSNAKQARLNNLDTGVIDGMYVGLKMALQAAANKLELEKNQIIDAYAVGKYLNQDDRELAEKYYNERYIHNDL